jgi:hypothetical protein
MPLFFLLAVLFFPSLSAAPPGAQEPAPELVLQAYRHTYPEKTGEVLWRDGDWTIEAGGEIFYWAGGRLLPAGERGTAERWLPHSYSLYPQEIPSPEIYSPEYIQALRLQGSAEAGGREDHHRAFQAALYGGLTRREIEARLERVDFFGRRIAIHRDIQDALKRVESAIREAARSDGETAAFIATIGQAGGYNWREIRGSSRMSYHSWGLAVDIQPKDLGGRGIYWRWERARNEDWMLLPLERRWKPPGQVITAFENEGFIWGGKWALYDNMHFEFRPELHELKRLLAAGGEGPAAPGTTRGGAGQDLHHLYPAFDRGLKGVSKNPAGAFRDALIQKGRRLLRRTDLPVPPAQ